MNSFLYRRIVSQGYFRHIFDNHDLNVITHQRNKEIYFETAKNMIIKTSITHSMSIVLFSPQQKASKGLQKVVRIRVITFSGV